MIYIGPDKVFEKPLLEGWHTIEIDVAKYTGDHLVRLRREMVTAAPYYVARGTMEHFWDNLRLV